MRGGWIITVGSLALACTAPPSPDPAEPWRMMSDGPVAVRAHEDGRIRSVRLVVPYDGSLEAAVGALVASHPEALGLDDASQLEHVRSIELGGGAEVAVFQRVQDGVPIYGAELRALGSGGAVRYLVGSLPPPVRLGTSPSLDAEAAVAAMAGTLTPPEGEPTGGARLTILDPALFEGGPGGRPLLAWETALSGDDGALEHVFVSAHTGELLWRFPAAAAAMERRVSRTTRHGDWLHAYSTAQLLYDEEGLVAGTTVPPEDEAVLYQDAPDAHFFASRSYNFWLNLNGWDSFDGRGTAIRVFVDFRDPTMPEDANAWWVGYHRVDSEGRYSGAWFFDRGMVVRDVFAHEYAHAVMDFFGGAPPPELEAGAVEEAMCDVFGALLDDGPAMYTLGEDSRQGVLRDLASPNQPGERWRPACDSERERFPEGAACAISDPDQTRGDCPGADETCVAGRCRALGNDRGGIHVNSGIGNRAFYLLHHGSEGAPPQDGCPEPYEVPPPGDPKVTRLYTFALALLTTHVTFADLREASLAWCDAFVATGYVDDTVREPFTRTDCGAIANAWASVEVGPPDRDLDGVVDPDDNCAMVANFAQRDGDRDGVGDACDPDVECVPCTSRDELEYPPCPEVLAIDSIDGDPSWGSMELYEVDDGDGAAGGALEECEDVCSPIRNCRYQAPGNPARYNLVIRFYYYRPHVALRRCWPIDRGWNDLGNRWHSDTHFWDVAFNAGGGGYAYFGMEEGQVWMTRAQQQSVIDAIAPTLDRVAYECE